MQNFLVFALIIVAHAATEGNKGYDITPLSKRILPAKFRGIFSESALISANPICREDAATLCAKVSSDNLLLVPCMQKQAEVRFKRFLK